MGAKTPAAVVWKLEIGTKRLRKGLDDVIFGRKYHHGVRASPRDWSSLFHSKRNGRNEAEEGLEDNSQMSVFRRALIAAAKAKNREREQNGFVGTISPAPDDLIERVLCLLSLKRGDVLVDLGCGDGRWCHAAAAYGTRCIGADMDAERIQLASCRAKELGLLGKIDWLLCDFISHLNLAVASVVVFYLSIEGSECVRQKALRECRDGTVLVAVGFQVQGWVPSRTVYSSNRLPAYVYFLDRTAMATT